MPPAAAGKLRGICAIGALFCSSPLGWSAHSTCYVVFNFPQRLPDVLVVKAKPKEQCPAVNSPAASILAPLSPLQAKGSQLPLSRAAGSNIPLCSEVKVAGTGGPGPPCSLLLQMLPWTHSPGSLSRWQTLLQLCVKISKCWRNMRCGEWKCVRQKWIYWKQGEDPHQTAIKVWPLWSYASTVN